MCYVLSVVRRYKHVLLCAIEQTKNARMCGDIFHLPVIVLSMWVWNFSLLIYALNCVIMILYKCAIVKNKMEELPVYILLCIFNKHFFLIEVLIGYLFVNKTSFNQWAMKYFIWFFDSVWLKVNTKFWEILKIGGIAILYNFDIFWCPRGCIISSQKM